MGSEDDERALAAYLDAVGQALAIDRRFVQAAAAGQFATEGIAQAVEETLESSRTVWESGR